MLPSSSKAIEKCKPIRFFKRKNDANKTVSVRIFRFTLCYSDCDVIYHSFKINIYNLLFQDLKIVHGDLKFDNLVLPKGSRDLSRVKIIDFGMSHRVDKIRPTCQRGVLLYRAPENILGFPIDHSIDMWALGALAFELYQLVFLIFPFSNHQAVSI